MQKDDFPALFRSADELSLRSQKRFFLYFIYQYFHTYSRCGFISN